jgi:hypothetical protein
MNVEIGAETTLFPEKEYIKAIFVAVHSWLKCLMVTFTLVSSLFVSPWIVLSRGQWRQ